MKSMYPLLLIMAAGPAFADLTIADLPLAAEQPNPVCRDTDGTLANCTATAGVAAEYLAPAALDGNNALLGTYLGGGEIYTPQGYLFELNRLTGQISFESVDLYYANSGCTGSLFVRADIGIGPGQVFRGTDVLLVNWYRVAPTAPRLVGTTLYDKQPGFPNPTCDPAGTPDHYLAEPSNATLTGVPHELTPLPLPIYLER